MANEKPVKSKEEPRKFNVESNKSNEALRKSNEEPEKPIEDLKIVDGESIESIQSNDSIDIKSNEEPKKHDEQPKVVKVETKMVKVKPKKLNILSNEEMFSEKVKKHYDESKKSNKDMDKEESKLTWFQWIKKHRKDIFDSVKVLIFTILLIASIISSIFIEILAVRIFTIILSAILVFIIILYILLIIFSLIIKYSLRAAVREERKELNEMINSITNDFIKTNDWKQFKLIKDDYENELRSKPRLILTEVINITFDLEGTEALLKLWNEIDFRIEKIINYYKKYSNERIVFGEKRQLKKLINEIAHLKSKINKIIIEFRFIKQQVIDEKIQKQKAQIKDSLDQVEVYDEDEQHWNSTSKEIWEIINNDYLV